MSKLSARGCIIIFDTTPWKALKPPRTFAPLGAGTALVFEDPEESGLILGVQAFADTITCPTYTIFTYV